MKKNKVVNKDSLKYKFEKKKVQTRIVNVRCPSCTSTKFKFIDTHDLGGGLFTEVYKCDDCNSIFILDDIKLISKQHKTKKNCIKNFKLVIMTKESV